MDGAERRRPWGRRGDGGWPSAEWATLVGLVVFLAVAWYFGDLSPVTMALMAGVAALGVTGRLWSRYRVGTLMFGLLRIEETSWLRAPHLMKFRMALAGCLMFAVAAGGVGWHAMDEREVLDNLRHHGRKATATVLEVTGRSEEGRPLHVVVTFDSPSGPVRADVDMYGSPTRGEPGQQVQVVYDPTRPTEVREVNRLRHTSDGSAQGAVVFGLFAVGFLAGAIHELRKGRTSPLPDITS